MTRLVWTEDEDGELVQDLVPDTAEEYRNDPEPKESYTDSSEEAEAEDNQSFNDAEDGHTED